MRRTTSIRFRLTAWYAAVLAAGLILFSVLLWIALRHTLLGEVDQQLANRANGFELFFKSELAEVPAPPLKEELEEFCGALPPLSYLQVRGLDQHFAFSYPANSRVLSIGNRPAKAGYADVYWGGRTYRALHREIVTQNGRYAVDIGASLDEIEHVLNLLRTMLMWLIPAVLALACIGSVWLSRRALKPVDAMTTGARAISIDNLSARLPVPQTGDELQRLAEAWNTMLERLEGAIIRISQFAADASHELRTPLSIIQTSTDLALRRPRTTQQYRESIVEIKAEAERMTRLVEDLLFLARADSSSAEMPVEPVNLSQILQEVRSELQVMAEVRGVTVRLHSGNAPVFVKGNEAALRRLFLVLLDNAIKYSEAGGNVVIDVTSGRGLPEVVIKDFGMGISAQDLPHIFERFYRADKARTHSGGGGHGLGLALAESIARRHGAKISVTSSLGNGSEFRVSFAGEQHTTAMAEASLSHTGTSV